MTTKLMPTESARRQNRSDHRRRLRHRTRHRAPLRPRRRLGCSHRHKRIGRAGCSRRNHKHGGHAIFEPGDVTRAADCQRVTERAVREFGAIHILFNNAGIIRRASVVELSEADWDRVMAVNVKSIFLMSRQVIPIMAAGWRRLHHQHRIRLGPGRRAQGGGVLCLQGRGRTADQGHGHRPRSAEYSRKLHLPRRHRHRHAAQRGPAIGRAQRQVSGGSGETAARTSRQAGRDRASRAVSGQRCVIVRDRNGAGSRRRRPGRIR